MIHNDVQNQLQLLIKTSAPPLIEVADHPVVEAPQWLPGQRLPAHVLASLPNGRFQVQVQDQMLDLNLPPNTQPGEVLELVYLGNSPRLTFALTTDLARSLPPNASVSLSEAAKFLGGLLQKSGIAHETTAPLQRAGPLVQAMPDDPQVFAHALRQAISQSGLFYESHQAQWLVGMRSLAMLLQEPQGRLSPVLARPMDVAGKRGSPAGVRAMPQNPGLPSMTSAGPVAASGGGVSQRVDDGHGLPTTGPVHPEAVPVLQQQLETLDTRQVVWQGQIWPGQDMRWEIEEGSERDTRESDDEASATWHTRLNLMLPAMGDVTARLAFQNGALHIDIHAKSATSADVMRQRQPELAERMAAAGLALSGLVIRHE